MKEKGIKKKIGNEIKVKVGQEGEEEDQLPPLKEGRKITKSKTNERVVRKKKKLIKIIDKNT